MTNRTTNSKNELNLNHSNDFIWVFINGKLSMDISRKDYGKLLQKTNKFKPEFYRKKYIHICSD